ncbi:hypothetical protein [Dictyobacter alpinus]|uniref:hypothetical protein n=1 Tax=Dictyobacter alpinus TaxID=2014873 RepID=UPI000F83C791|nr:hypothetical protein [Dictyobacter alpinus]
MIIETMFVQPGATTKPQMPVPILMHPSERMMMPVFLRVFCEANVITPIVQSLYSGPFTLPEINWFVTFCALRQG